RELHRLYRRGHAVMRTPSLGRLVRGAVRQVDALLEPPPGLVPLKGELLLTKHGAVLVNDQFVNFDIPERRLARMGYQRSDGAVRLFDPVSLEAVVPEPRLAFDMEVLHEVEQRWPALDSGASTVPGRYAVHGVVLLGARPDHLKVASPARRLAGLASLVD